MLQVSKPPKPTSSQHNTHFLQTQPTVQLNASNSISQGYSAHLPYHHPLSSLQFTNIFHPHCPSLTSIYQDTLQASSVNLPFHIQRCTFGHQNRRQFPELGSCTPYSGSDYLFYPTTCSNYITQVIEPIHHLKTYTLFNLFILNDNLRRFSVNSLIRGGAVGQYLKLFHATNISRFD